MLIARHALRGHPLDLGDHRVHVPRGADRQRHEAARVRGAPFVDVPVVVGLQHDEREVLVVGLLEPAAAEAGQAREAHRREHAVAVHVLDPLVDQVRRRPHLRERARVQAPLLLGPRHGRVEPEDPELLALELPVLLAVRLAYEPRRAVLVLRGHVVLEQVGRLDGVIVDAEDDHVFDVHVDLPASHRSRLIDLGGGARRRPA